MLSTVLDNLPLLNAAVLFILIIKLFFGSVSKPKRCYDEALTALIDMHGEWFIKVLLEDELTRLVNQIRNSSRESETDSETETETEFESETDSESETASETDSESETASGTETDSESDSERSSESEFRLDSDSELVVRTKRPSIYCSCHKCDCVRCQNAIENGCPYGCGEVIARGPPIYLQLPATAATATPAATATTTATPSATPSATPAATTAAATTAAATPAQECAVDSETSEPAQICEEPTAPVPAATTKTVSKRYLAQRRRKVE